ncbi:copper chaperone PCu(A)C [Nonomuraea sp. NPDC050310]|uniref:copper chaperone PCu(A)C n=1 Tax=unclassified Nonomuraea TaxID=2593643 RepID=UPI0033DB166F
MTSRRWIIAAAAFLAAPVLAGCSAGFDANTNKPYQPVEGAALIEADGSAYGSRGLSIPQAFVLGPDSGAQLTQGGSAPLYLNLLSYAGDTLQDAASDLGTIKVTAPVQLPAGKLVDTGKPTPQLMITGLTKALRGGESARIKLRFATAGEVDLTVPVVTRSREYTAYPMPPGATPAPTPSATPTPSEASSGGH